jgi:hypothetical protein
VCSQRIKIIFTVYILVMCLSFVAGCGEKHNNETNSTAVISTTELKNILNHGEVILMEGCPASGLYVPKNQETVLSKVTSWIQQAKLYEGKIPKSQSIEKIHAYIGPSVLNISIWDKYKIKIQPAFYYAVGDKKYIEPHYINGVLELYKNGQKSYIKSNQFYSWLKNNKWKAEFEAKH